MIESANVDKGIECYRTALDITPELVDTRRCLARELVRRGEFAEGVAVLEAGVEIAPKDIVSLNTLAWLLATRGPLEGGGPARAVVLAEQACRLTNDTDISSLDVLAAAYAAAGRYSDAVSTAGKGVALAEALGQDRKAKAMRSFRELYRSQRPYRAAPPPDRPAAR